MADQREVVIFQVKIDNDQFNEEAAKTRQEITRLKAEQKGLDQTTKDGAESFQRLEKELKGQQRELRELTKIQTDLLKVEKEGINSQRTLQAAYDAAQLKLKRLSDTVKINAEGNIELTEEYKAQAAEVKKLNDALKAFDAGLGQNQRNVGNYENSVEGVRAEIQRLREVMQTLDLNSKEFKDTKDAADNLQLSLDQALGKVNEFGEREPRNPAKKAFDDALESATALGSAIGLLSSLTGDNENAQEKLAKAMQAVAIAQTAANLLKAKGAVIDTITTIRTKSLAAAQWLYTIAVKATTTALGTMKAALISTGIGAVVVGITLLIQRLTRTKKETEEVTVATRDYTKELEDQKRVTEEIAAIKSANQDQEIGNIQRQIKLREAQGASEQELLRLELELLRKKVEFSRQLQRELQLQTGKYVDYIKEVEAEKDLLTEIQILNLKQKEYTDSLKSEGVTVFGSVNDYEKVFDLIAKTLEKVPQIKELNREVFERNRQRIDELITSEKEAFQSLAALSQDTAVSIGRIFNDSLTEAGLSVQEFTRRLLVLTLDTLQRQLLAAIAEIYFKEVATKGFAGIATGAALTAIVTGLSEAAKQALSRPVKFAMGGEYDPFGVDVGGKPHTAGGTKYYGEDGNVIELERGEKMFVTNRKASEFIRNVALVNQSFGGRGLAGGSSFLQSGGFAIASAAASVNSRVQNDKMIELLSGMQKAPVVSVTEINNVQNRVRIAEQNNSL